MRTIRATTLTGAEIRTLLDRLDPTPADCPVPGCVHVAGPHIHGLPEPA